MACTSPARDYRTWVIDSRRWQAYRPRPDDIVIATYPKCGTTWAQRIVSLLVFQTPDPMPVGDISPWIDRRVPEPIEAVLGRIEAQTHRRFLKSHLPFDGLPIHDEVKYLHVARDGRDACISFQNHAMEMRPEMIDALQGVGKADPAVGRPYPEVLADPAAYFHRWLTQGAVEGHDDGLPHLPYFHFERSWWAARHRPNVMLVHYNDLKADLAGEMQRIARFLGTEVAEDLWPGLVDAAGFESMRRDGDALLGKGAAIFRSGGSSFFHKGTNERWRGRFDDADLARYDAMAAERLPPACAAWLAAGRAGADPECS